MTWMPRLVEPDYSRGVRKHTDCISTPAYSNYHVTIDGQTHSPSFNLVVYASPEKLKTGVVVPLCTRDGRRHIYIGSLKEPKLRWLYDNNRVLNVFSQRGIIGEIKNAPKRVRKLVDLIFVEILLEAADVI